MTHVAFLPLVESVPIWGEPTGPRGHEWRATAPATLVWAEALDGGDRKARAPHRDRVLAWKAPFDGEPTENPRTEQRFGGFWRRATPPGCAGRTARRAATARSSIAST